MIEIDLARCTLCGECVSACPFGAVHIEAGRVQIGSGCKVCKICLKRCPAGALSLAEGGAPAVDTAKYRGILVYVEHYEGEIHPVTYELIGKALELCRPVGDAVSCLFIGHGIRGAAQELLHYGVKNVFVYDHPALEHFRADSYAGVFAHCIGAIRPSVVLVGATSTGRSLAPRVATRCRTGLTADCTRLERRDNSDLVQIRPAFGGNIMAQILTTRHRPQFATVRYKVMDAAPRLQEAAGRVVPCTAPPEALRSGIEILAVRRRPPESSITDADVLVVAGRGVKDERGFALVEALARRLGGQTACTRPLVEAGRFHYSKQIGLSGRTVKPKLILTCGVSGAVQFAAGMNAADYIVAINTDPAAPILGIAHLGLVGDLYEILPRVLKQIGEGAPA